MSDHKYKLLYFDGMGRAEVARLLFAVAGEKYVDERIPRDNWHSIKPSTPFGVIPVLYINGQALPESHAIERFLASELGLNGSNSLEAGFVDVVVEFVEGIKSNYRKIRTLPDNEKDDFKKNFFEKDLPSSLEKLDKFLKGLPNQSKFAVGSKLSLADLTIYHNFKFFWDETAAIEAALHGKDKIIASLEVTGANENVKNYIAHRPKTPF